MRTKSEDACTLSRVIFHKGGLGSVRKEGLMRIVRSGSFFPNIESGTRTRVVEFGPYLLPFPLPH